jgi:putative integral membrane protein (TIGR02587 family)
VSAKSETQTSPWGAEFDAYARAFGGAALFGMPLLFTMEMWWIGEFQPRTHLLGFVLIAFLTNILLARMSGFRDDEGTWRNDVAEAVEAMAVGVVLSITVLVALGQIDRDTSILGFYGMVAVQVIPLSVGAMVGNLVFDSRSGRAGDGDDDRSRPKTPVAELLNDIAATFVGAMFVGFAIAPTEEIPMLASGVNAWNLVAAVVLSLFVGYVIVFASGFDRTHRDEHVGGIFQRPFSETMLCLLVSLVASALLLFGFGQITSSDPIDSMLVMTIVLGVPASIGGAAGRVVV